MSIFIMVLVFVLIACFILGAIVFYMARHCLRAMCTAAPRTLRRTKATVMPPMSSSWVLHRSDFIPTSDSDSEGGLWMGERPVARSTEETAVATLFPHRSALFTDYREIDYDVDSVADSDQVEDEKSFLQWQQYS